jgi:hypothetical protein
MTLGVCPHPPRWRTAGTLRRPTFVRVAEPRCYTSLADIHTRCRVCPHSPRWPASRTHRWPTFVRVAAPRCHISLAYIIRTATSALILLAGLLLEPTDGLLSFELQNRAVTHRWPTSYVLPRLTSSSSLAYYSNAPMADFRSRCRTALLHLASLHPCVLLRLPLSSSLASARIHRQPRCRTALLHIAGLHHRHCRVCPHPPRWPTART